MSTIDPRGMFPHIEPDLVKVLTLAATRSTVQFIIVQGLRSTAQEQALVAKGASTTMHSRHLADRKGLAAAADVAALDEHGQVNWAAGHEEVVYGAIAKAVKEVAKELSIPIVWGGDWKWKDWGHYELSWTRYP